MFCCSDRFVTDRKVALIGAASWCVPLWYPDLVTGSLMCYLCFLSVPHRARKRTFPPSTIDPRCKLRVHTTYQLEALSQARAHIPQTPITVIHD